MGHEQDTRVAARSTVGETAIEAQTPTHPATGVAIPVAARHECLVCGEAFHLTPANHDGYGVVCPHCGGLN